MGVIEIHIVDEKGKTQFIHELPPCTTGRHRLTARTLNRKVEEFIGTVLGRIEAPSENLTRKRKRR